MDPLYNCALLVCCPPESEESTKAVAVLLMKIGGLDEETARKAAPAVQKTFDLMPPGTTQALKDAIAALAKQ